MRDLQEQFPYTTINSIEADITVIKDECCANDHHEKIYPWDSVGAEVDPGNIAWGATKVVIPIDGVTPEYGWAGGGTPNNYHVIGVSIMVKEAAGQGDTLAYQVFKIAKISEEVLNADSGVGQVGNEKKVYVADTSFYAVGDQVWVMDDNTADGEMGEIDTITTNTSLNLKVNMVADYTVVQNAKVYLIRRGSDNAYRAVWGKFAHDTLKSMVRENLHAPRTMTAGDGVLMRGYGVENTDPTVYATIIYCDEA